MCLIKSDSLLSVNGSLPVQVDDFERDAKGVEIESATLAPIKISSYRKNVVSTLRQTPCRVFIYFGILRENFVSIKRNELQGNEH